MPGDATPKIRITRTYDPLTLESYRNPLAPWVGIPGDRSKPYSMEMSRMIRLLRSYALGHTLGCSVLIGGDRGAGKTSLAFKAIEQVRSSWAMGPPADAKPEGTRIHQILNFPRPIVVRVHGPKLFDVERNAHKPSVEAMHLISEALYRALCDEVGELLHSRATTEVQHEKAAQFRMELDDGPTPARLREIWCGHGKTVSKEPRSIFWTPSALPAQWQVAEGPEKGVPAPDTPVTAQTTNTVSTSKSRAAATGTQPAGTAAAQTAADGQPPQPRGRWWMRPRTWWRKPAVALSADTCDGPVQVAPAGQASRELLAMATCIQICREVRTYRAETPTNPDDKRVRDGKPEDTKGEHSTFWKVFGRLMIDGGKLVHPLAGLFVGTLVFMAMLRSVETLPVALVAGILSAFSTTILLNFAAARNSAHAMLPDATLASLDRTIPTLLRRVEAAGLYPVIVVDELDKELDKPDEEEKLLEANMERLIRDMKYFVADQAFVCFLTGRRYYDRVSRDTKGEPKNRKSVDTFFTDRILVSHHPDTLQAYLEEVLTSDPVDSKTARFLQQLCLYKAKGHLADLQETITRDHKLDDLIHVVENKKLEDVSTYQYQVHYQEAVHRAIQESAELLRTDPNRLQFLNWILYGPARAWEDAEKDSFVAEDFLRHPSTLPIGDPQLFKAPLDRLLGILETKGPELSPSDGPTPLLTRDAKQRIPRYFFSRLFLEEPSTSTRMLDDKKLVKFRTNEERGIAIRELRLVETFVSELLGRGLLDVCRAIPTIVKCFIPNQSELQHFFARSQVNVAQDDLAELYVELNSNIAFRDILLLALFDVSLDSPIIEVTSLRTKAADPIPPRGQLQARMSIVMAEPWCTADMKRAVRALERAETEVDEWVPPARFILRRLRSLPSASGPDIAS